MTAKKEIKVTIKNQYGQKRIFPKCKRARFFAKLAGTATLTPEKIKLIKDDGYIVTVETVKKEL